LEDSFAQFEFDLDLDMVHEQAKALLDPTLEMQTKNGDEENQEQIEPLQNSNLSNEKEVSTEAHSLITIPLETQHEPQVSHFFEEPSYLEIFKDSCTLDHKSRNRVPKRILRSKLLGYIRWQTILLQGYQVLMKKGWKELVGHPWDRGRCGILSFLFSTLNF
jgi:hypothetical protein